MSVVGVLWVGLYVGYPQSFLYLIIYTFSANIKYILCISIKIFINATYTILFLPEP
jgi:hypothetical protein